MQEPIIASLRQLLPPVIAALLLMLALPARACYSGLLIIPTAETVGAGQYGIEFQVDGGLPQPKADTYLLNTVVGLGDRWEAGIDYDFSRDADPRTLFNAKYLLVDDLQRVALAAGVTNLGRRVKASPYLVATKDCSPLRLHLGAMRLERVTHGFFGVDAPLAEKWTLMADYTHGRDNFASLGTEYTVSDRVALLAGAQFPNSSGNTLFTVHLCYSGSYRK